MREDAAPTSGGAVGRAEVTGKEAWLEIPGSSPRMMDGFARPPVGPESALSRTADNLYWLSRYSERADFVARILDATPGSPPCRRATAASGTNGRAPSRSRATSMISKRSTTRPTKIPSAIFSPSASNNSSSIRNCIEIARDNARAVRTALTVEMWDAINGAWLELKNVERAAT